MSPHDVDLRDLPPDPASGAPERPQSTTAPHPAATLDRWAGDPRLVWTTTLPGRRGAVAPTTLPEYRWRPHAPDGLWEHQVAAIDALRHGRHTVISTGTGSGKSLCYQLPIAEQLVAVPTATALIVQPTKALAHDQLQGLRQRWPEITSIAYDGDADVPTRQLARREARIVVTNPEMLHAAIAARHTAWARLLGNLRFVVLDEIHAYRGVFGSHVAQVIRRLRRLSAHHGGDPTFACTSATVGDADLLASELVGDTVHVVDVDASASSEQTLAIWDPRQVNGARSGHTQDTAQLTAELIEAGHRTITFARARATTESVAEAARRHLSEPRRLLAYRGGYLPAERRGIELAIAAGDVDGIVSTSALELGVDIGELDAAVIHGFPGTLASFRQQIGRVGRRGQPSLAVLVLGDDQLDGWIARHPNALVDRPSERVVINPDNPVIARPHLACAAHELPLEPDDARWWGDGLDSLACDLARADLVRVRNGRLAFDDSTHPGRQIGLRSGDPATVRIETTAGRLIGTVDASSAPTNVHEGARYVHQGTAYDVVDLDLDARIARVVEDQRGPCRSSTRSRSDVEVLDTRRSFDLASARVHHGTVRVTSQVTSFRVTDPRGKVIDGGPLELPPHELVTEAFWLTWGPDDVLATLGDAARVGGSLHAAEHALIGMLPLFAICDRWDVGGLSIAHHPDTGFPTVFVHEGTPGGAGLTRLATDAIRRLVETTRDHIGTCTCEDGCPTCVVSPKCGNGNEPLDKPGAVSVLGLACP